MTAQGVLIVTTHLLASITCGWPVLAVNAVAGGVVVAGRRLELAAPVPEIISLLTVVALLGTNAAIAICTGGLDSPLLPLLFLSLTTQAIYLRATVARTVAGLTIAAIVAVGLIDAYAAPAAAARPGPAYLTVTAMITLGWCLMVAAHLLATFDAGARSDAAVDPLTGAFNRRALSRHFGDMTEHLTTRTLPAAPEQIPAGALAATGRPDAFVAFIVLNIDFFKAVNDTHGHERGDDVLREFAQRVSAALRPQDMLHRIGGEEFLVFCAQATPEECVRIAERVRNTVRASPFAGLPGRRSLGRWVCRRPGLRQPTCPRC